VIFVGCFNRGAFFQALGWSRVIDDLFFSFGHPEARHPLKTVGHFGPVAGNPTLSGRNIAPNAADPNEIVSFVVPGPVAWHPNDVISLRLIFWGDFLDRFGGLLCDDQGCFGIVDNRFGKSLMNRAAGE
jgi:hypothetical protein